MIYEPREDSLLLEKEIKKYAKGKDVLDIGTGNGIQAIAAKKVGAKSILASDINQEAVEQASKLGINCIKSDLFSDIKGKFDLIVFNPPYLPADKREDKESALTTSGGKRGDEITLRFLKQSVKHLNEKGKILLLVSSLTPLDRIIPLIKKLSFKYKVIAKEKFFMEELFVWEIKKKN